jgi:hypothetical protein
MERHALDPPGRAQTRPFPSLSCLDLAKGGLKRGSDRSLGLCCRRRHCAGSWSRSNNYVRPLCDERKQTRDFPRRPESDSGSLDREARSTYHHIDDIDLSDIALSSRSSVISFTIYHKIANIEPPLIIPVHLNRRHIILLSHISPQHHTPFSVRDITLLSQINPQHHSFLSPRHHFFLRSIRNVTLAFTPLNPSGLSTWAPSTTLSPPQTRETPEFRRRHRP